MLTMKLKIQSSKICEEVLCTVAGCVICTHQIQISAQIVEEDSILAEFFVFLSFLNKMFKIGNFKNL